MPIKKDHIIVVFFIFKLQKKSLSIERLFYMLINDCFRRLEHHQI